MGTNEIYGLFSVNYETYSGAFTDARIPIFSNRPIRHSAGNMNFLIPSAKKTSPGSNRTTTDAAGALVFRRLKRGLSIGNYFDFDVF